MGSRRSFFVFSGITAIAVFGLAGCSGLKLNTAWKDRAIAVDGIRAEWRSGQHGAALAEVG